jgi:hypothetical protein
MAPGNRIDTAVSRSLSRELRRAHEQVFRAAEGLEAVTLEEAPDEQALSQARWRLSSASLERRLLWGKILAHLVPVSAGPAAAQLRRLQDLDIRLLRASTQHVREWTLQAIFSDWQGYRNASRDMRWRMITCIEQERMILYPMLCPSKDVGTTNAEHMAMPENDHVVTIRHRMCA